MKVSVIVPVYNVQDYIEDCLQSLADQSYKDFEVVIVEDCSTDNSKKLVEKFIASHEQFRMLPLEKNGGLMHAWMEGVMQSQGEYLFFVDSDDTVTQDALQVLIEIAEKYNTDITCGNSFYDTRRFGGGLSYHNNYLPEGLYKGEDVEVFKSSIFPTSKSHFFSPGRCAKLYKKELFVSNLKYCDPFITSGEDVNIVVPCVLAAKSIYYIDKPIYNYLQNPHSISHVFNPKIMEMYNRLISILSRAANDYGFNASSQLIDLYIHYGYSWCVYVMNSTIPFKDKKELIRKLFSSELNYVASAKHIHSVYGVRLLLYKWMMTTKCPFILFVGNAVINTTRKAVHCVVNKQK